MKTKNFAFILGVTFIAILFGMSLATASQPMKVWPPGTTYGYGVPFTILIITSLPFLLGLIAGSSEN